MIYRKIVLHHDFDIDRACRKADFSRVIYVTPTIWQRLFPTTLVF